MTPRAGFTLAGKSPGADSRATGQLARCRSHDAKIGVQTRSALQISGLPASGGIQPRDPPIYGRNTSHGHTKNPAPLGLRHPSAFTLVELVVVCGILATLVGILVPAIGRTKDQAKSIHCLSNLRQMAVAATGYAAGDRDRRFPNAYFTAFTATTVTDASWDFTRVRPRTAGAGWTVVPGLLWRGASASSVNGGLSIQQCPAYDGPVGSPNDPYSGYNYNTSFIGHGEDDPTPARVSEIVHPDRCALFGDGGWAGGTNKFMRAPFPNPADASFSDRFSGTQAFRHLSATNAVFADGHAESLTERYTSTTPANIAKIAPATGFLSPDNSLYSGQ